MGGAMAGSPADGDWTQCTFDWCSTQAAGSYVAAKIGTCTTRAGYGIIVTTGGDCRRLGGAMNGTPGDGEWTTCHLDWCSAGGSPAYAAASVGSCGGAKVAYGIVKMRADQCTSNGGRMNGTPAADSIIDCHFDWCLAPGAPAEAVSYGQKYKLVSAHGTAIDVSSGPPYGSMQWANVAAVHKSGGTDLRVGSTIWPVPSRLSYGDMMTLVSDAYGHLEPGALGKYPAPVQVASDADWQTSFDHPGYSECPGNTLISGLWRTGSNDDWIYMLERARCNSFWGTEIEATVRADWSICLDRPGVCQCPQDSFVSALSRSDGQSLQNIEEARCVKFKDVTWRNRQMIYAQNPANGSGWQEWKLCPEPSVLIGFERKSYSSQEAGLNALQNFVCAEPGFAPPVAFAKKPYNNQTTWQVMHPREGIDGSFIGRPVVLGAPVVFKTPDGKYFGAAPTAQNLYLHNLPNAWETWRFSK
jgi:hypothetical protein